MSMVRREKRDEKENDGKAASVAKVSTTNQYEINAVSKTF